MYFKESFNSFSRYIFAQMSRAHPGPESAKSINSVSNKILHEIFCMKNCHYWDISR